MCLAVPMKIDSIDQDKMAVAEIDGCTCKVNLALIDDVGEGDYVIVHAGYAIEKLDRQEADARLALFEDLAKRIEREEDA